MSETFCASDGRRELTPPGHRSWRLAGLALVLILGAGVIGWIAHRTWTRLGRLEQEFDAMETQSFYLGVRMQAGLEQLNGALLRFQLSRGDTAERDRFHSVARELSERIARTRPFLASAAERDLVGNMEPVFQRYLTETGALLDKSVGAVRRDSAVQMEQQLRELSMPLRTLCDQLVRAQETSWAAFLEESQQTLASLRGASQLSFLVWLAFLGFSAWLAYRTMVSPLRLKLDQTQTVMQRQEKLASLGTLAAGVAHEIRNPLAAIKFRLFSLRKSLPAGFDNTEDVTVIGDEIIRLERIIQAFLQFARPAEPVFARVTAQQIVETVRDLLQPQLASQGIEVKVDAGETVWLRADAQQIQQVLINLVQNAADSIPQRGTITLRVRSGAARLQGHSSPAVVFEVEDTGTGIAPDVQMRLFDPFFSTKEAGTGLGLPIAERIVEKHGGRLQYQTQHALGTTFQVVLPRAADHASQDPAHRG